MAKQPNFLLGRGEKLTKTVPFHQGFGASTPPYEWDEQREHLQTELDVQQHYFDNLPAEACPDDQVVSLITLHPQYYSRSAFPEDLLQNARLRLIGSKSTAVRPRAGRGSDAEHGTPTTAMFVAGKRQSFRRLARSLSRIQDDNRMTPDLIKIEEIKPLTARTRIAGPLMQTCSSLEVVLHFDVGFDIQWEEQFQAFAKRVGVDLSERLQYQTRGLWFLAAKGTEGAAQRLAQFSFVRAIRPMPVLRAVESPRIARSTRGLMSIKIPEEEALDPDGRVAIFDGGLPADHPFTRWATAIEPAPLDGIGNAIADYQAHGMAVTSALLFGSIGSAVIQRPFCSVDHYRVLGDQTDDRKLYSTMLYVDKILSTSTYEFANFSIGPAEVVGDDKVTAWTAMLDDHFQQGNVLAGIAVGNDGDEPSPHNRVQVPSDCVNAIAVGATDGSGPSWARASYSSIGPGRAPGVVRPEMVAFGGDDGNEFRFLFPGKTIAFDCGTSFATPTLLRTCAGLRAHFGRGIGTLALRALMVHTADCGSHPRVEVGWGLATEDLSDITVCPDGSVRVLYQGVIDPAKVIRAEIPLPAKSLSGRVNIKATFCYVCETDPNTPGDYTRAGLDVCFRPHRLRLPKVVGGKKPDPAFPSTKTFFEGVGRKTEQSLRNDAYKWDTVRHAEHRMNATSLSNPVFDIHYVARQPGSRNSPAGAKKIPYALVITVTADKHPELYNDVVSQYAHVLEAIRPRTELPVRLRE